MENVIAILIDSVFSQCIGDGRTSISSTPYIDKLKQKGVFLNNVFSYGPYTDAATKGLYCSEPTLSNLGYYYGINSSSNNHFKTFKDNGYETYGFYYPYYLISSKVEQYIDHSIYTSGFLYNSVWFGKFEYYANVLKTRELSNAEIDILIKCLDMVFDCWLLFYKNLKNYESGVIICRLKDENNGKSGEEGLREQYRIYVSDKRKYLYNLLETGMEHPLANVNDYNFSKHVNQEFLNNDILHAHNEFFRRLKAVSKENALIDSQLSFRTCFEELTMFLKTLNKDHFRYFVNYGMYFFSYKMFEDRCRGENWQLMASMNRQIETLLGLLKNRKNSKPFYASLHVLEPHHSVSFFSYDSDSKDTIDEEIDYLSPLISADHSKKCGNVLYQASLRYVDLCVKRLVDSLEKNHLLENTTIMLVADHGSSYTFKNIRTTVTNNFHTENYNVPLVIWNKGLKPENSNGLFTSADVFPILWNKIGLKVDMMNYPFSRSNIDNPRDFIISEYLGPGCPDMISRDVWIAARNKKYIIGYKQNIQKPFDIENPTDIYDLEIDPNEKKNLAHMVIVKNNVELFKLALAIEKRFKEIVAEKKLILENFDKYTVIKAEEP